MAFNELRAIAVFTQAAELGSLRQAAVSQGITPQAASQALTQLESHLGVRLFHRTTRRLSLTEEGERFLSAAAPGLQSLQRALHAYEASRNLLGCEQRGRASSSRQALPGRAGSGRHDVFAGAVPAMRRFRGGQPQ